MISLVKELTRTLFGSQIKNMRINYIVTNIITQYVLMHDVKYQDTANTTRVAALFFDSHESYSYRYS